MSSQQNQVMLDPTGGEMGLESQLPDASLFVSLLAKGANPMLKTHRGIGLQPTSVAAAMEFVVVTQSESASSELLEAIETRI